jgi:hypothetical protein
VPSGARSFFHAFWGKSGPWAREKGENHEEKDKKFQKNVSAYIDMKTLRAYNNISCKKVHRLCREREDYLL